MDYKSDIDIPVIVPVCGLVFRASASQSVDQGSISWPSQITRL